MIVINCPYCITKYKTQESTLGKTLTCKKCSLKFKVSTENRKKLPFAASLAKGQKLIDDEILSKIVFYTDRMKLKGQKINIEEVLINKGGVPPKRILEIYKSLPLFDKAYCMIAVEKNFATKKETEDALNSQKDLIEKGTPKSVGRILIDDDVITERQHLKILEIQNERSDFEEVIASIKPDTKKTAAEDTGEVNSRKVIKNEAVKKDLKQGDKELLNFILKQKILTKDALNNALKDFMRGKTEDLSEYLVDKKLVKKELVEYHRTIITFRDIRNKDKEYADRIFKENPERKKEVEKALKDQLDIFTKEKRVERLRNLVNIEEKVKKKKETSPDDEIRKVRKPNLVISADNLKAVIEIPEAQTTDIKDIISYEKVERLIIDALIKFGMTDTEDIKNQLSRNPFDAKNILIAKGIPAKEGRDAVIKTYFKEEFLSAGKVNAFGMIDFRDRGEVPQVKKDELLAEKFPMVKGEPGKDIFGQPISVDPVKDEKLLAGDGTYLSDDNLKLYAKVNGQPTLVVGKIAIHEVHEIKGDVDYSTGHVIFNGNIRVPGKISSGFKVEGVNVEVSDVEGGIIKASGDVVIKNAVLGGTIVSKGSVSANFVSKSKIDALGNIIVNKQIIDTRITTSGAVSIENGQISNSQIVARQGISAKEIGTNLSKPCRLAVGTIDHIEREVKRLEKTLNENRTKLEDSMNLIKDSYTQLRDIHEDIRALAKKQTKNLNDEKEIAVKVKQYETSGIKDKLVTQQAILQTCMDNIKKMDERLRTLLKSQDKPLTKILVHTEPIAEQKRIIDQCVKDLEDFRRWESENPGIAIVNVSGHLNEGTYIKGTGSEITLKKHMSKCVVKEIQLDSQKEADKVEGEDIEIEMEMVVEDGTKKK